MPATSDRRRSGLFALLFFLGTCGLVLGLTDWDNRLSTRILDLLPVDENSVEAKFLAGYFKEKNADRIVFALHTADSGALEAIGADLRDRLERTGLFQEEILTDRETFNQLATHLHRHRLSLFFPAWLRSRHDAWSKEDGRTEFPDWLAIHAADQLDRFVDSPEGFFFADGIRADPLLLLPKLWQSLGEENAGVHTGWLTLSARLRGSAFDDEVQDAVIPALSRLRTALGREHPEATLLMTGPVLFAQSSRLAIRSEVEHLNLFSVLAVALVVLVALRRPVGLMAIAPLMVCGLAGGLVATLLFFGSIHIVMLVLGAFLAGITVDYGFHAFLHPSDDSNSSLWKPLSAAAGSTAAGFATLMFGTLPVVRQLGLFVAAGVISALFAAYCLRPVFPRNLTAPRPWFLRAFVWNGKPSVVVGLMILLLAGALTGIQRIAWHDDIRELDLPSPQLRTEDERIRDLSGSIHDRSILLTTGTSLLESMDAWREMNRDWEKQGHPPLVGFGAILPSTRDLALTRSFMEKDAGEWAARFRTLLAERGYDPAAFNEFFEAFDHLTGEDFSDQSAELRLRSLSDALKGTANLLLPRGGGLFAVASITTAKRAATGPFLQEHPETVSASQLENLNEVFARYRREGWKLVLSGFLVVAVAVLLFYGLRRGTGILLLPVFGVTVTFGLLGWLHRDLNLFHLLAGLLGFCLALDHALFAVQARADKRPPPASVRISALTTAVAFGVIAASRIPAVSSLGWTVACTVVFTALLIELLAATGSPANPSKEPG